MEMLGRRLEVRGSGELNTLALSEGIYARNPGKKCLFLFISKYQNMYFFHLIVSVSRQGP